MARIPLPLPSQDKDYESRKSRAKLVNLMVNVNKDGSFRSIIKREGITVAATNVDPIVSNFQDDTTSNGVSLAYFCSNTNLFELDVNGTITDLGAHGLALTNIGIELIQNTTKSGTNVQTLGRQAVEGTGGSLAGFIYDGAITAITDVDFTSKNKIGGDFLSNRFWFAQARTVEFFASDPGDGFVYDPLIFASADERPGEILAVKGMRSNLWVFTTSHIEYWQSTNATFPLRRVQGATINSGVVQARGIGFISYVDRLQDYLVYVASDFTVRTILGSQNSIISDLDFSNLIEFDQASNNDIFPLVSTIDTPNHKYAVITMAGILEKSFTWVYDFKTGYSHYRTSPSNGKRWDMYKSINLAEDGPTTTLPRTFMMANTNTSGAFNDPNIYRLDPNVFDDAGTSFECILQTGSISFDMDSIIEYIEIEMETGVGNVDSTDPVMTVKYSRDGGVNFLTWGTVELGTAGDTSKRIRMNNFGRLVRHTDFVLQLTITEPVRVEFYGAYAEITGGF